ncbi:hypothetical protein V490_09327 [Pseudogymnoascus sp. VKM F-3557]|nr:hypothetical protein V490_09327 [Pseudogymnoascus sp. VKM F-3557]
MLYFSLMYPDIYPTLPVRSWPGIYPTPLDLKGNLKYLRDVAYNLDYLHRFKVDPLCDQINLARWLSKGLRDELSQCEKNFVTSISSAAKLASEISTYLEREERFTTDIARWYAENELLRPIGSHDILYWKDVVGVLRNYVATTDEVFEFEEVISRLHINVWEFFLNGSEYEIASATQVTNAAFLKENACSEDTYWKLWEIYDQGGEVMDEKDLRILRFHPVTVGGENTDIDCEQSNIREF